ncbi:MAG: stage II sporulation protein R, partial [Clostridia bacterium]|nr:stage II sporulation protein R [Clostridia bacterium]
LIFMLLFWLTSLVAYSTANNLQDSITRLHILANSDSYEDQMLKIKVRDAIISNTDILEGGYSKDKIDDALLEKIEDIARETIETEGFTYEAKASFTNMYFDTCTYDGFAIPAGYYDAVRVEIGEGRGKNWWCVLFPPLCAPLAGKTVSDVARDAGLTENDVGIIMKDGEIYALRFRSVELLGKIKHLFDNQLH